MHEQIYLYITQSIIVQYCSIIQSILVQDVYDGQGIKTFIDADPRFVRDQRCPMLMLIMDPFQVFKDDQKSSAGPVLIVNMNAPIHLRYRIGLGCHFMCFDMGSAYKEKGMYHMYILLITPIYITFNI